MTHQIVLMPQQRNMEVVAGSCLLDVLRLAGLMENAPCGGIGTCGKCKVLVDGEEVLACQTVVDRDMTVTLPNRKPAVILTAGISREVQNESGLSLAVDIGTTTVAAYLMENGNLLATESALNPQSAYGADVVSRISHSRNGHARELTSMIRTCVENLTERLLSGLGKSGLQRVCVVGNPAMQQLFMGLPLDNLTHVPFRPLLTKTRVETGETYIPAWNGAELLIVPDISGYIGADTVAGILATGMDQSEEITLLVDIGTNGEMVLGNKDRMVACATAAGPALEGALIRFGMRAQAGAIDRVDPDFTCHVIGDGKASGICGSGLLDAVAAALHDALINQRGRILKDHRQIPLADGVYLTQEDIRQFQQAKGAIAAGIRLMAKHLGISLQEIHRVYLAGAFGTFLNPHAACRTGLLPGELEGKIIPVGNAAGSGARLMACDPEIFETADAVVSVVDHLDLAVQPEWARCFADSMRFVSEEVYWVGKALSEGFTEAVPLNPETLTVREDVRAMCAADRCNAYGKNWTCPPHCGDLDRCEEKIRGFFRGILVQTVGITRKTIDSKAYRDAEKRHLQQFYALSEAIKKVHPQALCLGSGGCRICGKCAYPDPCRFPEKACPSMESYGLFVTDVCRSNGLSYHHGANTITYTACILF